MLSMTLTSTNPLLVPELFLEFETMLLTERADLQGKFSLMTPTPIFYKEFQQHQKIY